MSSNNPQQLKFGIRELFGAYSLQPGSSAGALDLERCVSVLSQRWTVFGEIRGSSVFVRTFLDLGTLTANWPRNETLHSKNVRQR
jgi:hypothetical protein